MNEQHLIGMTLNGMETLLSSMGQPRYRADQLFNWIYKRRISSFDEMSNFSKSLRSRLKEVADIGILRLSNIKSSSDQQTHKFLFELEDGLCVEGVFMAEGKRRTTCLSSQVGCALNCDFCATGKMGFQRHLSAGEIVDQLLFIQKHLNTDISNIVLMGMGEPFLNYDNVMAACDIISHDKGIAIGKRKITISTSGIIPAIKRFTDEGQKYKLAISLNAADDALRDRLMPINRKYPVAELMNAARYYAKRSRYRLTFEYVLIRGINDGRKNAIQLQKLLNGIPCKLNIIPYNKIDGRYRGPAEKAIHEFIQPFLDMNIVVSVRRSKGEEIDAACGQLYYTRMSDEAQLPEHRLDAPPGVTDAGDGSRDADDL